MKSNLSPRGSWILDGVSHLPTFPHGSYLADYKNLPTPTSMLVLPLPTNDHTLLESSKPAQPLL